MAKIQLSQRMYSIRDIVRLLDSMELSIQPKYQRRRTSWPTNAKTALIDTIMNNFPLPPIYLRDYVNDEGKRRKEIIDGQQRISTIVEFYRNEFQLSKNFFEQNYVGLTFSELPNDEKQMLEDFEVSFISIRGASEADIISIFSRLNSFSLPLNTQEKRNSLYAGEFKTLIYELASEYNTFWTVFKILNTSQIARMADAALVTEIIDTILKGISSSNSNAEEKLYQEYDNDFPKRREIYQNFNSTITILGNLLESELILEVFKPKFMFYTLFIAIYSRLNGIPGIESERTGKLDWQLTKEQLEAFSKRYLSPIFEPTIKSKFKQATGNMGSRKFRHDQISKYLI